MTNSDKIEYKIYDIPGLNDSATKNIFYDYVKNNFYKFDIVVYNVDINSGLNTTDELDILNLIKSCIHEIKTKYNKEVKLVIICNKCDDSNDEIEEMYEQVCDIVKKNGLTCPILKYSAVYTYMYRSVNTPENLDKAYIDKIGIDSMGRVGWSKQSKSKNMDELWDLIKVHLSENIDESLKLSGFDEFKNIICSSLDNFYELIYSKINFITDIKDFETRNNFIIGLDELFEHNYGVANYFSKNLSEYLNYLDSVYNIKVIDDSNIKLSEEYFEKLSGLQKLKQTKKDKELINGKIKEYNRLRALYDFAIIKNTSKNIGKGEIFKLLEQIIAKTDFGIKMLLEDNGLANLLKVPIDDFSPMINYLSKHIEFGILKNLYVSKLINYYNAYTNRIMVHNCILKYYFATSDELFNWICSCINTKDVMILGSFKKDDYEHNIKYFNDFIEFYETDKKPVVKAIKKPENIVDDNCIDDYVDVLDVKSMKIDYKEYGAKNSKITIKE